MRIYLVIVDEPLFHPRFVADVVRRLKSDIIGITIVPDKNGRPFLKKYFWLWRFLGVKGCLYFAVRKSIFAVLRTMNRPAGNTKYQTVGDVAKQGNIPIYTVDSINEPAHLKYLKRLNIDLIVAAQGQIFRRGLLEIPRYGCLNRHGGLLPEYKGLWPVFWAMLNDEREIGVTAHMMEEKIDTGRTISEKRIRIMPQDTMFSLYQKAFNISGEVVYKAVKKIYKEIKDGGRVNLKGKKNLSEKEQYYSMPGINDIRLFKKKGFRIM